MGSQYEGDPTNFPDDYTIPDDSDPPIAAMFNVAIEALGDRTAYLREHVAFVPMNWPHRTTSIGDLAFAFFDTYSRSWFAVGDAKNARRSYDGGISWSSSVLSGVGAGSEDCDGGDSDGSGKIVIASTTRYAFVYNGTSWSRVDVHGVAADGGVGYNARAVHDPISGLWCTAASIGIGNEVFIATNPSPGAVAWTARTKPTGFAVGALALAVDKVNGRTVLANHTRGGNLLYTAYSTDGGATWSSPTLPLSHGTASSGSPPYSPILSLAYHPENETWLLITGEASGTPACAVFRSTDGHTWTKVLDLLNSCITNPAPFGGQWVALAYLEATAVHEIVFSRDDGETWEFTGVRVEGSFARGCYAGGSGLIALTETYAYASLRTRQPTLGTLT